MISNSDNKIEGFVILTNDYSYKFVLTKTSYFEQIKVEVSKSLIFVVGPSCDAKKKLFEIICNQQIVVVIRIEFVDWEKRFFFIAIPK